MYTFNVLSDSHRLFVFSRMFFKAMPWLFKSNALAFLLISFSCLEVIA